MLGEWPADRFEAAWEAYQLREALDLVERQRSSMTYALYANGMIGGDDLTRELNSINEHADATRAQLLGQVVEEEMSYEAPMPKEAPEDAA